MLASHGESVVLEDPVYPGLRNAFLRGGARVIGVPMGADGIEVEALRRILEKERPRLMVLTPNFQNPTGTTIPEDARKTILDLARRAGVIVVENDLYGPCVTRERKSRRSRSWTNRAIRSCWAAFRKSRFRACAWVGRSGRGISSLG